MVRPLALVAVREQQADRAALPPLGLARRDELVDDRLGAVGEVTELGLPQHERVRPGHRVAVLEAHRGELGQQRVVDVEGAGARLDLQRLQRRVLLAGVPVDQDRVPLAEGAAPAVLPGEADGPPVQQDRTERDGLGARPVDRPGGDHLGPALELRAQPRVDGEALRQRGLGVDDLLDDVQRHGGGHGGRGGGLRRGRHQPGLAGRPAGGVAGFRERLLQLRRVVLHGLLGLGRGDVATADQGLRVELAHRPLGGDGVVHQRLGERRLVHLVVAAPPVAHHVDHDVLVERLPELDGQPRDAHTRLGVVPVDVEDRGLHHPGDVGGVHRRPAGHRRGREPDLVVDDEMHGAAGAVAAQLGEVQRLGDHALAGEGGVPVDEHGQDGEALRTLVEQVLFGTDDAFEHRVDRLQVGGVGHQGDRHLAAVGSGVDALGTEVVLDVTRAVRGLRVDVPLELGEDLPVGLADDVRQDVETATVGHPEGDLVHAGLGGPLQDLVQQRDCRLPAFEGEAPLPDVLGLQEGLERLGRAQPLEDVQLLGWVGTLGGAFDPLLDPDPLVRLLDVHVLDADPAAVGVPQDAQNVAQGHRPLAGEAVDGELAVEVPQGQPVADDVEVGVAADGELERVGVGHQVAADPVGVDQFQHPGAVVEIALVGRGDVGDPLHRLVRDAQ